MNFTSRMVALLTELRRERNGAVADAMRYYGAAYGLNYGVSLPTVRALARAEKPDHDFAHYLFKQDVRELRLMALHLAEPARLSTEEANVWAAGIINSEVAEEAAFALLSRSDIFPQLFDKWIADRNQMLQYAALLAAARSPHLTVVWLEPAVEALRRSAAADESHSHISGSAAAPASGLSASLFVARGAVALLVALAAQNKENRLAVIRLAGSLGKLPAEDYVHEELAWRLEE
ncbi:DNA alkylation repair protein [uncultured Alistipes sp.]|uniref:DNA alkylation repair protein n=1 Tax=uncultured Alistipes sp. TaxID=538949 RepID=UPI0027D951D9|nr:DNA alkylation repair protein [uncultured Alistipes sp.]